MILAVNCQNLRLPLQLEYTIWYRDASVIEQLSLTVLWTPRPHHIKPNPKASITGDSYRELSFPKPQSRRIYHDMRRIYWRGWIGKVVWDQFSCFARSCSGPSTWVPWLLNTLVSRSSALSITGVRYSWEQFSSRCQWNHRIRQITDTEYSNFTDAIFITYLDIFTITYVIAFGRWLFNGLLNMLVDAFSFCQKFLRQSRHYGMWLVVLIKTCHLSFMMI